MANTAVRRDVEAWIRDTHLPKLYRQKFGKKKVKLTPGGVFEFDAVSEDQQIVANISTAGYFTSSGCTHGT